MGVAAGAGGQGFEVWTRASVAALVAVGMLVLGWAFDASPAMAGEGIEGSFGSTGPGAGQLNTPRDLDVNDSSTVDVNDGTVYVADFSNNRVAQFAADGTFIRVWGWGVADGSQVFQTCSTGCQAAVPPSSGAPGGSFIALQGIGIDQSTGNVYVQDRGNQRLQVFGPNGDFIRAFGWDVDSTGGSGQLESCTVSANCKAGSAGTGAGQLGATTGRLDLEVGASGNVYVSDPGNKRVQVFSSTGNFLFMFGTGVNQTDASDLCTAADVTAGDVCGAATDGLFSGGFGTAWLAVNTAGTIFAADRGSGLVREFSPTGVHQCNLALSSSTATFLALSGANLLVAETLNGELEIEEWHPTGPSCAGSVVDTHLVGAGVSPNLPDTEGMGANATSGKKYLTSTAGGVSRVLVLGTPPVAPVAQIDSFTDITANGVTVNATIDPNGPPPSSYFFEFSDDGGGTWDATPKVLLGSQTDPQAVSERYEPPGLLVPEITYQVRLVVEKNFINPDVVATGSFQSIGPAPSPVTLPPTNVTGTSATINGTVDPEGVAVTQCVFEYGTTTSYGQLAPCIETPASIGTGTSPVPVHADLQLAPGTVYHYRLKGTNANGFDHGDDEAFQTLGPAILATWSEDVGLTEATLKAEIDPEGKATTYRFEYGTTTAYGSQTQELPVGSDSAVHEVSSFISGLSPRTTYHFRVIATNSDAAHLGPDRTFTTFAPPITSGIFGCPNETLRAGSSAGLPDCRAYEMVSPVEKGGGDIFAAERPGAGQAAFRMAAIEGGRITYTSVTSFGDAQRGAYANQYIATRGGAGWSSHAINPPLGTTVFDPEFSLGIDLETAFQAFTPDLCLALMQDQNLVPLKSEAIEGYTNLYQRDNCEPGADAYNALTRGGAPSSSNRGPELSLQARNYSSDMRHAIFTATAALDGATPEPAVVDFAQWQIYDYDLADGELRLVSVLPNGNASPHNNNIGTGTARRAATLVKAVSTDGSRVFWTADPGSESATPGTLYLRVNPGELQSALNGSGKCTEAAKACTIEIVKPLSSTAGVGQFWTASDDGSQAIFSIGNGLFAETDAKLYELDVDKAISDGGADEAKTLIAGEAGGVVGASDDLSRLYFTSKEALDAGAVDGELNLYLREGGVNSLIATLEFATDGGDGGIDNRFPSRHTSRVSPSGRHLAFMSSVPLTDYDNTDANTDEATMEVFVYDSVTEQLRCVSCNPSGARPVGRQFSGRQTAAWIPTWEWSNNAARSLSEDGARVFFNSFDSLVPTDVNGVQDVYQWEAPGSGSCEVGALDYSAVNAGCVSLLSTGHSPARSQFLDASADGDEIFLTTESSIDPRDPGLVDIYVAKVGGGYPPPPLEAPACVGDACQQVPAAPGLQTPSSLTFQGPGNVKPRPRCRKGKVRRKGRCVAKKRQRGKNQRKRSRAANSNRRAGR